MQCFDCTQQGRPLPAVGVCAACGAGVCAECVRLGRQSIRRMDGFVSADISMIDARVLNCPSCADAMHAHHPTDIGLARR